MQAKSDNAKALTMDYYLDIRLRPDPEFTPPMLLAALYAKLHRALVQVGSDQIGVSFPVHTNRHLGDLLRLHGPQVALQTLQGQTWLGAMTELVQVSPLQPIPPNTQHRAVRRVQAQVNPERVKRRLVKRLMQREGIAEDQAQARIDVKSSLGLEAPYILMQSKSTGQRFKLFIVHGQVQSLASPGSFNAYGLSSTATIPWF